MRPRILLLLLFSHTLLWANTPDTFFDDSEILQTRYPSWFKDSFLDLGEDLQEAREAGKQGLMLYFGTAGCAYCMQFMERSLREPDLGQPVRFS